jgi:hypothetical protein
MTTFNGTFISYRRDPGYASAKLIWTALRDAGIDAFLDLESMNEAGDFNARILNQIAGRPYFVIVLTEGTLDRCVNPGDWLWRELEFALAQARIIVPAMIPPFDIDDADRFLPSPEAARALKQANGVTFPPDYFEAAQQKLIKRLQPVELARLEFSPADHDFARRASEEVERRPVDVPAVAQGAVQDRPVEVPPPSPKLANRQRRWMLVIAACLLLVLGGLVVWKVVDDDDHEPGYLGDDMQSEDMLPGEYLESDDGHHVLELTPDGRLVASTEGREWWSPNSTRPGEIARMQLDGNLVVYGAEPYNAANAIWASQTQGNENAVLRVLEHDGHGMVAIYDEDDRVIFSVEDEQPRVSSPSAAARPG